MALRHEDRLRAEIDMDTTSSNHDLETSSLRRSRRPRRKRQTFSSGVSDTRANKKKRPWEGRGANMVSDTESDAATRTASLVSQFDMETETKDSDTTCRTMRLQRARNASRSKENALQKKVTRLQGEVNSLKQEAKRLKQEAKSRQTEITALQAQTKKLIASSAKKDDIIERLVSQAATTPTQSQPLNDLKAMVDIIGAVTQKVDPVAVITAMKGAIHAPTVVQQSSSSSSIDIAMLERLSKVLKQ